MIKAILFDIDNTLVDFMKMKRKSCEAAVEAMISAGLKMEKEDAMKEIYAIYAKKGMEYRDVFEKIIKKSNGKIDYKIMASGVLAYRLVKEEQVIPYEGVISTLKALKKKYKLAVVSDAPAMKAWTRLIMAKLDGFFDLVLTKSDVKRQKTSTVPFNAALKHFNIEPEEAIMVGDRIERDIQTPKKLGIKTCFARYGVEDLKKPANGKSGADFEINEFKDLIGILKGIKKK